jgi:hypothetical protein
MTFPQYAVSKWIGHSTTVSGRHYANDVPDEMFEKASGGYRKPGVRRIVRRRRTKPYEAMTRPLSGPIRVKCLFRVLSGS